MATDVDVNCRDVVKGAFSKGNGSAGFCPRVPRLDQWVNRSFRAVERAADWLMGSAGPIFVTLCIVLVSIGAWTFFLLFLPSAFPPRSPSLSISFLIFPLALLTCLSIMHTIAWFYYTACRTPPGFVASFALESCRLAGDDIAAIDARWRQYAAEARGRSRWVDDGTIPRERLPQMRSEGRDGRIGEAGDDNDDDHWPRVKMCFKCPQIPLWKALAYLPPELREVERNKRTKAGVEGEQAVSSAAMTGLLHEEAGSSLRSRAASPRADDEDDTEEDEREKLIPSSSSSPSVTKRNRFLHLTAAEEDSLLLPLRRSILTWLPPSQAYTLVPPPKPERTHHCSVCKICVIKYDHHCPWLNQCVGLYNERHFLMFLFSLTLGMAIVLACGTREFIAAAKLLRAYDATPRLLVSFGGTNVVPRGFVLITYILCAVMGFALCVMGVSHLLMLGKGETNVEASDRSSLYEGLAKRRGVKFANVYSMGNKWENWRNWGSVALPRTERGGARRRGGEGSSTATGVGRLATLRAWLPVLLPVRRETTWSDGWHWPKRKGLGGVHAGIAEEEELTDEEVERDEQEQPGANEMSRSGPPPPAEGSHQPEMRGRAAAERQ